MNDVNDDGRATAEQRQQPPPVDARARLLDAAARLYARGGESGATTRLISEEAGVNEVTLFRLFGSKTALLDEAVRRQAAELEPTALPDVPTDPARELTAWCAAELERLGTASNMIRMCFAEASDKPDRLRDTSGAITAAAESLRSYVERLVAHGWTVSGEHREAATSMLLAALISDSLGRVGLPGVHPPESRAPGMYARAFLALLQLQKS